MAEIKAFKGMRYTEKAGEIGSLCCPPYDIIYGDAAAAYLGKNPYNVIRIELPTCQPSDDAYAAAGRLLREWLEAGILQNDENESIYVYEMQFTALGERKSVTGFISLVKLEEFAAGIILPHEETLSKAKTDRFNLMNATDCNFSQIYSLYNDSGEISALLAEIKKGAPTSAFTDGDDVTHRLWVVSDIAFIEKIANLMSDKKVYIADGHHRYETALNYRNGGKAGTAAYVPMMLVDMENPGLVVFPTHRIVRDLPSYDEGAILQKCAEYFEIISPLTREESCAALEEAYNKGEKAFALYSGGKYVVLKLKDISVMEQFIPEASADLRNLDVSVLHTLILQRVFGIDKENMANQINLTYTRVFNEAISAVDEGKANCSFLLNSTRIEELSGVAAAGEKMPQKSTYFYPKLTTGLVMNQIIK